MGGFGRVPTANAVHGVVLTLNFRSSGGSESGSLSFFLFFFPANDRGYGTSSRALGVCVCVFFFWAFFGRGLGVTLARVTPPFRCGVKLVVLF